MFERLVDTTEFPPESEVGVKRIDSRVLQVQFLLRDDHQDEEPLSLDLDAWEMMDPSRTEQLRDRICKVGDLLDYLGTEHRVHPHTLNPADVRKFGIRIRGPEDDRYYGLRLTGETENGGRKDCDLIRVDDAP